jgi:hypothetical protein
MPWLPCTAASLFSRCHLKITSAVRATNQSEGRGSFGISVPTEATPQSRITRAKKLCSVSGGPHARLRDYTAAFTSQKSVIIPIPHSLCDSPQLHPQLAPFLSPSSLQSVALLSPVLPLPRHHLPLGINPSIHNPSIHSLVSCSLGPSSRDYWLEWSWTRDYCTVPLLSFGSGLRRRWCNSMISHGVIISPKRSVNHGRMIVCAGRWGSTGWTDGVQRCHCRRRHERMFLKPPIKKGETRAKPFSVLEQSHALTDLLPQAPSLRNSRPYLDFKRY